MNFRKLLKTMPLRRSFGKTHRTAVVFDEKGDYAASFEYSSKAGGWRPLPQLPEANLPRPCTLVLPASMLALVRTPTPNNEQKDALADVETEAAQRLFRSPETGGREVRFHSGEKGMTATLGWVSNELLHKCLETAKSMGFQVTSIVTPEFDLKSTGPTILVSRGERETRLCCIHKNVPLVWQVVPEGGLSFKSALGVILAELKAEKLPMPEKAVFWNSLNSGGESKDLAGVIESELPGILTTVIRSYEEFLPLLRVNRVKGSFHESLEEWGRVPLASRDYLRAGLAFAGAIAGCLLLFFSVIHLNTQDAAALKNEAKKIMFLAKRTDLVTMEIREYARRNRDILRYTVQKPFVSHVFRDLGDSVPAQVKLNTMRLDRSGKITLQGESKNEISLMSLLENLSSTEIFSNAVLASMSKLEQGLGFRFVVEIDFPAWQRFFKPVEKQEKSQ